MKTKYNLVKLKRLYDLKGWVLLKNFIPKNDAIKNKNLIKAFLLKKITLNKKSRLYNFVGNNNDLKNLNSFHELGKNKYIKKKANSDNIKKVVKKFLNSEVQYRHSELFAKPAKIGLPSPIHQDNFYWAIKGSNALTVWIALDKSNKQNGCIYYYDGSHKKGILSHKPSYAKGSSQTIKNKNQLKKFKISYPSLDVGDALIHHCLTVHGSSKNNSKKSRQGWTIQFKDKKAKYDLKQKKIYEKSLNKQIQMRS
jgi:ectoine hydroxylase-related dioxygenase (phytanoyl-CoA dioxygenase family)